ncbi:MAG: leucine--tRNA ligase [Clostridia bacterium]|nr:leucine--tRNA ligase [Clostridia bacterium]
MNYTEIDKKWNTRWQADALYKFDKTKIENKHYVLEMFSYPSGAKLHVGHWYNYGMADIYARYMRAQGKNVFHPMGFDAFGLPAENYAIKTGVHPADSTHKNISIMEQQLRDMGASFDWDYELATCNPDYYKWTQWMFIQLFKHGLAYRKNAPVNWCTSCNTVLANEQVIDGHCERCGSEVLKKNLTQWFFKTTAYAQELLDGLDKLDWPEKTKLMQKNWIGKSNGAELVFKLYNSDESFSVFTTRADTLFGCSYAVLAPEHPLVNKITTPQQRQAVEDYKLQASKTTEIERLSTAKEKTGVFTGAYAINPINGKKVQVWVGDYVLATYGTGAIMGVPSHDERDYIFAHKHNLDIVRVIKSADDSADELPYTEYGIMVNSGKFNGMTSEEGAINVAKELEKQGLGKLVTNYRLRDWLVSRQRYWGAPIPIVYCPHCGMVPVPEKDLPVLLPYDVEFTPDGASPLAKHPEFSNVTCPICGAPSKRECDTLDTFVCSSWYFLRYPDNKNEDMPFDKQLIDRMLPVDKYVGGPEHACTHLMYSRFFVKALRDMGYLDFDEPFKSLVHQGVILGPDGNRMSKSHGNVISPDTYVSQYGSDIFRSYIAFAFKYIEGGPWKDEGVKAIARWYDKVERVVIDAYSTRNQQGNSPMDKELKYYLANTIKCVGQDYQDFSYNTAVARMMELVNTMAKYQAQANYDGKLLFNTVLDFLRVLTPLAPHICEELWEQLGQEYSICNQRFPSYNDRDLVMDTVELAVQINSKIKCRINVDSNLSVKEIETECLKDAQVIQLLDGMNVKKVIVIPNRLINIIV